MEEIPHVALPNLQRRFPDVDVEVIIKALNDSHGHAGRAAQVLRDLEVKKTTQAKIIAPLNSSAPAFPASLGPFDLQPTSLVQLSRRHGGWTLAPSSLEGVAKSVMLAELGVSRITGSCSPEHPVTLPEEARQSIGIPKSAISFAWSYPIAHQLSIPQEHANNADLAFFTVGGFVYFSADGSLVHAASLVPSPSGGLRFGPPKPWEPVHNAALAPAAGGMARFHAVTIPELRDAGTRRFCWVMPGEVPGLEHGAFAYQFGKGKQNRRNVYFPVLGGDTSSSTKDVSDEVSALCAELAASNTTDAGGVMDAAPWDLAVNLSIIPGWDSAAGPGETVHALVSLQPVDGAACQRSNLCIVLDISGSMNKEAVMHGRGSELESNGFALLDIAKHAVRTIMHSMGPRDQCALVAFNAAASCVFQSTLMDDCGKAEAEVKLDALGATGKTNIWNGLQLGLDILGSTEEAGMFNHIMLLTDGKSSASESIVPNLMKYKTKHGLPCSINAYGFGYSLDSDILASLATTGCGTYGFIPDAGFVGTVFVNSLSNVLVTMGRDVLVELIPGPGVQILPGASILEEPKADGSVSCRVGTLQFGQSRDLVVPLRVSEASDGHDSPYLLRAQGHFEVSREPGKPKRIDEATIDVKTAVGTSEDVVRVAVERCRFDLTSSLPKIVACGVRGDLESARAVIQEVATALQKSPAAETEQGKALLEDLLGQISEATSKEEWFTKWGVHYLPSLRSAHETQQCNNFKDPSVQCYGGDLFNNVRDAADDTFNSLPAPKPSRPIERPSLRISVNSTRPEPEPVARPVARPVTMADYNDRYCG